MKYYAPEDSSRVDLGKWMWPRLLWIAMQNNYTCWTVYHNGIASAVYLFFIISLRICILVSGKAIGGICENVPGDLITTPFWTKLRAGILLLPLWFGNLCTL